MKDLLMAMTTALLVFTTSCSKDKPIEPVDPIPVDTPIIALGKVFMLKNGVQWDVPISAKYYPGNMNKFLADGKAFNNSLEEKLSFRDIPVKKGIYMVERRNVLNHYNNNIPDIGISIILDLDQLLNFYDVDSTRSNQFVEILHYDSINHIVEGRFQTFLEGPTTYSFLPDSIALTEGKFHLKIEKN